MNALMQLPVSQIRNGIDHKGEAILPKHEVIKLATLLASKFALSQRHRTLTVHAVDEHGNEIEIIPSGHYLGEGH